MKNIGEQNEIYSFQEVDEMVEEIRIEINEGKVEPADFWLNKKRKRTVDFASRDEVVELCMNIKKDYGVEVSVITDISVDNFADILVGRLVGGINLFDLKKSLEGVSNEFKVVVDFGERWFVISGKYGDDGDLMKK